MPVDSGTPTSTGSVPSVESRPPACSRTGLSGLPAAVLTRLAVALVVLNVMSVAGSQSSIDVVRKRRLISVPPCTPGLPAPAPNAPTMRPAAPADAGGV